MGLFSKFADLVRRRKPRARRRAWARAVLELYELEPRCLFAWTPLGPMPQWALSSSNPDVQLTGTGFITGRVNALAIGQNNGGQPALFLGALDGHRKSLVHLSFLPGPARRTAPGVPRPTAHGSGGVLVFRLHSGAPRRTLNPSPIVL
jgi:hypothetical protein